MLHFFRTLGVAQYCDSIRANEVDGPMLDDLIRTDGLAELNIVSKLHASKVRSRFRQAMSPTGPDATPKSPADGDATKVAGDRGEDWPQHAERPEAPFDAGGQFSTPRRQPSEHFGVSLGGGPSRLEHSSDTENRSRSPSVCCRRFRRIARYRVRGVESLGEVSDRANQVAQDFLAGKGKKPNISDCKQGKRWQVPKETRQENQMLTRCRCNTHKGCAVWMKFILTDHGEFEAWESFTSSHTAEWNVLRGRRNGSDVVKSPCTHAMKASVADTIEEMGREAATKLTPLQLKDLLAAADKPTPPAQYLRNALAQYLPMSFEILWFCKYRQQIEYMFLVLRHDFLPWIVPSVCQVRVRYAGRCCRRSGRRITRRRRRTSSIGSGLGDIVPAWPSNALRRCENGAAMARFASRIRQP